MQTKKFLLSEQDIPRAWYNVVADMTAYDRYFSNDLTNYRVTDEDIARTTAGLEQIL